MTTADKLNAAATAVQQAKKNSTEDFLFYEPGMLASGSERMQLGADLRKACA